MGVEKYFHMYLPKISLLKYATIIQNYFIFNMGQFYVVYLHVFHYGNFGSCLSVPLLGSFIMIEPDFLGTKEEVDEIKLNELQDLGVNGNLESMENHITNMVGSNIIDEIVEEAYMEEGDLMSEKLDTLLETPTTVSNLDAKEVEKQVNNIE